MPESGDPGKRKITCNDCGSDNITEEIRTEYFNGRSSEVPYAVCLTCGQEWSL